MIELRGVGKDFGGVRALDDVSLTVARGECHALMGENGAGKSTLGRILAGIHRPDRGELLLDGARRDFRSPRDALLAGIAMVHQELAFVPELSVAENLSLGRMPRRWWRGAARGGVAMASKGASDQAAERGPFTDRAAMERRARELLARVGADLDVRAPVGTLSTAQEQLVQIAAAVGSGARVIVFDEPTSSLAEAEARRLFTLIRELRAEGATILYVSHRMPEVFALCDRLSVLRDGRLVATRDVSATNADEVVRLMIGRDLPAAAAAPGPRDGHGVGGPDALPRELLRVEALSSPGKFAGVSFTLREREIVGLAGLVGAGRSEVARALFGLDPAARGGIIVAGRVLPARASRRTPRLAIDAGLALIPEDRKRQGLVPSMGARMNWSLPLLARLRRRPFGARPAGEAGQPRGGRAWGLLDRRAEREGAAAALLPMHMKMASLDTPVAQLSGGNQQKVVLARWLSTGARVLLADEPTRGVDVGAKSQIHDLLRRRAAEGAAVLLISSELPELLALCDRVLVMRAGRLVAEIARADATEESVLRAMAGVGASGPASTD